LCHLQHKLIGFYNRDEKCLQRGTDWVFKWSSLQFVCKGLNICQNIVTAKAITGGRLAAKTQLPLHPRLCGICGNQSGKRTGFRPSTFLPHQYHWTTHISWTRTGLI